MNARVAFPSVEALAARAELLRKAFTLLRQRPAAADQARLQMQVQWIHAHNVADFGWMLAESARACAFADVIEQRPSGEARESDFAAFLAATRDDPYSDADPFGALDGAQGARL